MDNFMCNSIDKYAYLCLIKGTDGDNKYGKDPLSLDL